MAGFDSAAKEQQRCWNKDVGCSRGQAGNTNGTVGQFAGAELLDLLNLTCRRTGEAGQPFLCIVFMFMVVPTRAETDRRSRSD